MKKIKIMLAAIAVFAVVGGALAFKAKTPGVLWYTNGTLGQCVVSSTTYTTTIVDSPIETYASTTSGACDIISLTDQEF
jgi:hypothetical protein